MEEKKPTYEEVIRLLEIFANDNEPDGVNRLAKMALDFINRLQNEVSQWKSKAEHIEEVYDADREHFIKTTTEQKAEIERLTEENEHLDMVAKQALADYQNAQVQVDELKGKICELVADKCKLVVKEKQAVKDTAKEIIDELNSIKPNVRSTYGVQEQVGVDIAINRVKTYFKQKGVEVE